MNIEKLRQSFRRLEARQKKEAQRFNLEYFEILDKLPPEYKEEIWYADREPTMERLTEIYEGYINAVQ